MSIRGDENNSRVGKGQSVVRISVVVPAFNEEPGIVHAIGEIERVLEQCSDEFEIIVVDDGSRDATFEKVRELSSRDAHVKGIRFSRNFGKEAAILAGLKAANGDVVITIDADLQHPPALIPEMLEQWRKGYKVVHAVKADRSTDTAIARFRAYLFNGLLEKMGGVSINNSSDFKLLDRVAVNVLIKELSERGRFYRGLADWIGFRQVSVPFTVATRNAGEGKWSIVSLIGLAITAIVSFTSAPLRIVTVLGFVTLVFGFFVAAETLWSWFMGRAVSGFATTIITVLILGSFIMISLGIMGEYIAKIYDEIKARPVYLVESSAGFEEVDTTGNIARNT